MKTFIIKYSTILNGNITDTYHEKIELNKNKEAMNVYVEHVTTDRGKALRFYEKEEANKLACLCSNKFHTVNIIQSL